MIDKIKTLLKENGIEVYRINCIKSSSAEMFFIKDSTDMVRSTNVTEYSVTVYHDFLYKEIPMRGHASTLIFSDMNDDEITKALKNAFFAASFVKNKYYPLPKPTETKIIQQAEYNLKDEAAKLAQAVFSAETDKKKAFINSVEVFAKESYIRIVNSEGIDVQFKKYRFDGELVTQSVIDKTDVELYTLFSYNEPDCEQLRAKATEALNIVYDRAGAKTPVPAGKYDIILTGENLAIVLDYYIERSQGAMVYAGYSSYKEGTLLQGEEVVTGEKLNITLKATQPYSAEGISMKDCVLAQDGKLKAIHSGARFAHYLGIEPTGEYGAFECDCGSDNFENMKKGALYVAVFSDFQMDSLTGQFGGEIRLAYMFDEIDGKPIVKKFTGGSINGSIFDAGKSMVFSKEKYKDYSYEGPYAVRLSNISVAGE